MVFVSSDSDLQSFEEYYKKMPWLSLSTDADSASIKQKLAQMFQIRGIPSLIAIDAKSGRYITNDARSDVMSAGGDDAKQKEVIQKWKSIEAVPIEEADLSSGAGQGGIGAIVTFLLRNPVYIFGLLYFANELWRTCKKWEETMRSKVVGSSKKKISYGRSTCEVSVVKGRSNTYDANISTWRRVPVLFFISTSINHSASPNFLSITSSNSCHG